MSAAAGDPESPDKYGDNDSLVRQATRVREARMAHVNVVTAGRDGFGRGRFLHVAGRREPARVGARRRRGRGRTSRRGAVIPVRRQRRLGAGATGPGPPSPSMSLGRATGMPPI
jgi:hypothetical protein